MKKFLLYLQLDGMDCGPTCLRMIAQKFGKSYTLQHLRELMHVGKFGVTMLDICEAAEQIGLRAQGAKVEWQDLIDIPLPVIVHWDSKHFVVVYRIKKKRKGEFNIYIADPSIGFAIYSKDEFLNHWICKNSNEQEGYLIAFETTPSFFIENKKEKFHYSYLLNYLYPYKKYIFQVFLGMTTGVIISVLMPFLTQAIVDYGIGTGDVSFIVIILIAQLALSFGKTMNELIRNWLMLHITARFSIALISDFLIKLMKLPISFFDAKLIGDILQRIDDHGRIQTFLTGTMISMLFAIFTFIIYTFMMASYHGGILLSFIVGSAIYILWVLMFLKKRRAIDHVRFREAAANQNSMVQLITGMQEIKLNGCEKQKRWMWEKIQVRLFNASVKGMTLQQNQQIGATMINELKNIVVSYLAARAVIGGDMTLGMMVAIQYIIAQLNVPIDQFINFIQSAQDAKISIERLGEIHQKEDEESQDSGLIYEIPPAKEITIKDLSFRYDGPHSPKVLENINLVVPAGKTTAIIGGSGSGKTTLIKILLGFYEPEKGEVLIDNQKLQRYSPHSWRMACGVVMQEGVIFSDTLKKNICILNDNPDEELYSKAIQTANLQEFINKLPYRDKTNIGIDGHGLSSGQKQRVLIARSVYKDPGYIFLDEATNSLDANNELIIMENLNRFFKNKTVVIVAHRLSTVKNADQIIVMDSGKIIESGTHNQLIATKGAYYKLVKNQLDLGN